MVLTGSGDGCVSVEGGGEINHACCASADNNDVSSPIFYQRLRGHDGGIGSVSDSSAFEVRGPRPSAGMWRQEASDDLGRRCHFARSLFEDAGMNTGNMTSAHYRTGAGTVIELRRVNVSSRRCKRQTILPDPGESQSAALPPSASIDDVHQHSDESAHRYTKHTSVDERDKI